MVTLEHHVRSLAQGGGGVVQLVVLMAGAALIDIQQAGCTSSGERPVVACESTSTHDRRQVCIYSAQRSRACGPGKQSV